MRGADRAPALAGRWLPELAARLPLVAHVEHDPLAPTPQAEAAMAAFTAPFGPPEPTSASVTDLAADGPSGPVPVRVYRPATAVDGPVVPALLWLHGGGFIAGDLDMPEADAVARGLVTRTSCVVVSVDYRLCLSGVRHPVPHEDCWAVFEWLRGEAGGLGADPARIAVGGASAGATLAASVALRARDQGLPVWQALLAYPVLHTTLPEPSAELAACLQDTPAALRFPPGLRAALNRNYLGGPPGAADAYAYPGVAEDLTGFPPTYLEAAEFDELRSSAEEFARQLAADGAAVEYRVVRGTPHGHLNLVGFEPAARSLDRMAERLATGPTTSAAAQ